MKKPKVATQVAGPSRIDGAATAPIIHFEGVPVHGVGQNGVFKLTLSSTYLDFLDGAPIAPVKIVAHLKCNETGLNELKEAIRLMEAIIAKPPGAGN